MLLDKIKKLTAEEERKLAYAAKAGDIEARNTIVMGFAPMVLGSAKRIALKFFRDIEDVFQVGIYKILKEYPKYDPDRHLRASTYFMVVADRAMKDFCAKKDALFILPATITTPNQIAAREKALQDILSINDIVESEHADGSIAELLIDHRMLSPEDDADRRIQIKALKRLLNMLEPRARQIVQLRMYESLDEIGKIFGISKERVRQIELAAMKFMRSNIA